MCPCKSGKGRWAPVSVLTTRQMPAVDRGDDLFARSEQNGCVRVDPWLQEKNNGGANIMQGAHRFAFALIPTFGTSDRYILRWEGESGSMEGYLAGGGLGADLSSGGNPAPTQFWTATLTEVQPAGGAGPGSRVASAQPSSWQAAPHGFQAPLQTLWPPTAQQVQQQPLWASQAEDRGGGLQPPPLPALQQQGTWAAAAADSMTWAVGNGRLDPETMAAKLAAAREKNRLAQQRFRERQRAKQREAGEQCDQLLREMEEVGAGGSEDGWMSGCGWCGGWWRQVAVQGCNAAPW